MIEDPLAETTDPVLEKFDTFFLIAYTLEMVLKIFAKGFVMNKTAYIRDYWNVLDFVIVVTAYIPIILGSSGNSSESSGPNL